MRLDVGGVNNPDQTRDEADSTTARLIERESLCSAESVRCGLDAGEMHERVQRSAITGRLNADNGDLPSKRSANAPSPSRNPTESVRVRMDASDVNSSDQRSKTVQHTEACHRSPDTLGMEKTRRERASGARATPEKANGARHDRGLGHV